MSAEFDPNALLRHWFMDTRENPDSIEQRMDWWFTRDIPRDRWLTEVYGAHCEAALDGRLDHLAERAPSRLALILLADQLPRNLYRGTARAFAGDARALELCIGGHRDGLDRKLSLIERVFFWMPLQHVEDLELQNLGVELYETLAPADPYRSKLWNGFAAYARQHRDIIARFGRFPHRNAALKRDSTPEELEYLDAGGATFSQ